MIPTIQWLLTKIGMIIFVSVRAEAFLSFFQLARSSKLFISKRGHIAEFIISNLVFFSPFSL